MTYSEWTFSDVRSRLIEAAEILMLEDRVGPGTGSAWPAILREVFVDEQPDRTFVYRRRASAAELSQMMETWDWINAMPGESDRRLLYAWAWVKARKGRSVEDFARDQDVSPRTMRGWINVLCQQIADRLNRAQVTRRVAVVDLDADQEAKPASNSIGSQKLARSPRFERAIDAKPHHDETSPELRRLIRRLEKQNLRRERQRAAKTGVADNLSSDTAVTKPVTRGQNAKKRRAKSTKRGDK